MISSRPVGADGAVRLLLLTVLLGLFGMHVLTAHGSDHHGGVATVSAPMAGHGTTGHHGSPSDAAVPAPAGMSDLARPGAPADDVGLLACWLLITVGVALIALLLRGRRVSDADVRTPRSIGGARPGRPRAPPGRMRLHELTVLRV